MFGFLKVKSKKKKPVFALSESEKLFPVQVDDPVFAGKMMGTDLLLLVEYYFSSKGGSRKCIPTLHAVGIQTAWIRSACAYGNRYG